ncbi:MAG: DUF881 domain-containing protein [Actinomycetota bacterium]|nr:DUF881 domain-containing protein [Actinomycetota bacterium]
MKFPSLPTRWRPHVRAGFLIGLLCALLGFGFAVQVRSTQTTALPSARQEDLVRILDDLSSREDRLRSEIADLEASRSRINSSSDRSATALQEARQRSDQLGVLAGTVVAHGPGVLVTVQEGAQHLPAEVLLDALEELRGAGAEAVQISGAVDSSLVRVGASTWFADHGDGIDIDGTTMRAPYHILAIGDGPTMAAALRIPGGVIDTIRQAGGSVTVEQRRDAAVTALRPLVTPQYARPAR